MSKSYWMGVSLRTKRAKAAVMSWFNILGENVTPNSAEVLCDKTTDKEKKLRVFGLDTKTGQSIVLTRTFGKTWTVKREIR